MKQNKNPDASERLLDLIVIRLATIIDRTMIFFYRLLGDVDKPCGKLQTWARMKQIDKERSDRKPYNAALNSAGACARPVEAEGRNES